MYDYYYECDSRAAWDTFAADAGFTDASGNPTTGMNIDWIGKIVVTPAVMSGMTVVTPAVMSTKEYVNVRYAPIGSTGPLEVEQLIDRKNLLASIGNGTTVKWIDPATIPNYPRVWAGGMMPFTNEKAVETHEALYQSDTVVKDATLTAKLKKEIAWIDQTDIWTKDPIMTGHKVTYDGKTWESLVDYNVWAPPIGWREVVAQGYPAFVQPVGAVDAYALGARVSFKGKNYESLIAANVWSPEAYPAGWREI